MNLITATHCSCLLTSERIFVESHCFLGVNVTKRRPTTARVEFLIRPEQHGIADNAGEQAVSFLIQVLASERSEISRVAHSLRSLIPPSHSYRLCLQWTSGVVPYNVVLTARIRSTAYGEKCQHLWRQQSTIKHTHYMPTCARNGSDNRQEINIYPNWLYCTLEWYVELKIRHTTPDIRCTQLYSLTMATKATFCQKNIKKSK